MQKLVIQDDEGKTTVVPLIRDEITIGRKEGNTIRLTERNVSRKHARIMRANGHVAIEDLGSYNGVRVNGTRISGRADLTISDRIQIGDYLIELKAEGAEEADAYGEQKTQPIERIDPMATTPTPDVPQGGNGHAATAPTAQGVPQTAPAAPTVPQQGPPAHALADTDPGLQVAASGHARLVVLSSNFAGREFELNKPAMVIGRTDDNDIVINHRSISRNHAKIVRENDRYAIVDLQSSNGVRVNGEEYGKVELRRSDYIDLGHVRMRFVEAGEDFVFGRDAQVVDIAPKGGRGLLYGLIGLLVIGGIVGLVVAGGGDEGGDETVAASDTGDENGDDGTAGETEPSALTGDPEASASDAAAEPSGDVDEAALDEALTAAQDAVNDERWADAQEAARKALEIDADSETARRIEEQAERELTNELRFKDFQNAVKRKTFKEVATLFEAVDNDSVYKDRMRDDHDRLRKEYTGTIEKQARLLAKRDKCRELRRLITQASTVWEEAGDAARKHLDKCKEQVAVRNNDGGGGGANTGGGGGGANTGGGGGGKSAATLIKEAEAAAKTGQFGKALRLCQDALSKAPGNQQAVMVCAIAACNLKNTTRAKRYTGMLRNTQRKQMARQICLRNGVKIQ